MRVSSEFIPFYRSTSSTFIALQPNQTTSGIDVSGKWLTLLGSVSGTASSLALLARVDCLEGVSAAVGGAIVSLSRRARATYRGLPGTWEIAPKQRCGSDLLGIACLFVMPNLKHPGECSLLMKRGYRSQSTKNIGVVHLNMGKSKKVSLEDKKKERSSRSSQAQEGMKSFHPPSHPLL